MIVKVTMYACKCDNCLEQWEDDHYGWTAMTDESSMKEMLADEDEWHTEEDKHYCGKCFQGYDDEDNLIIDESRKKLGHVLCDLDKIYPVKSQPDKPQN